MSRCVFTLEARADLLQIHDYIAEGSPANALRFVDRLEEQCVRLVDHPRMGIARPEFGPDHRSFIVPGLSTSLSIRLQAAALRLSTYVTGAMTCADCSSSLTGHSVHSRRRWGHSDAIQASRRLGVHVIG